MIKNRHEPVMITDDDIEGQKVVCINCGKVLWIQTDEQCIALPPLGVSVSEGIGTLDSIR